MFKKMVPKGIALASLAIGISFFSGGITVTAIQNGGGYAITSQLDGVGYSSTLYDADNGLPTSDANYILSDNEGNIWIGSGLFRSHRRLGDSDCSRCLGGIYHRKTFYAGSQYGRPGP